MKNMRGIALRYAMVVLLGSALLSGLSAPTFAQAKPSEGERPADNLEIVHEKLKADKKLIVAKYMQLTEAEARKFWPVYEEYQKKHFNTNLIYQP